MNPMLECLDDWGLTFTLLVFVSGHWVRCKWTCCRGESAQVADTAADLVTRPEIFVKSRLVSTVKDGIQIIFETLPHPAFWKFHETHLEMRWAPRKQKIRRVSWVAGSFQYNFIHIISIFLHFFIIFYIFYLGIFCCPWKRSPMMVVSLIEAFIYQTNEVSCLLVWRVSVVRDKKHAGDWMMGWKAWPVKMMKIHQSPVP